MFSQTKTKLSLYILSSVLKIGYKAPSAGFNYLKLSSWQIFTIVHAHALCVCTQNIHPRCNIPNSGIHRTGLSIRRFFFKCQVFFSFRIPLYRLFPGTMRTRNVLNGSSKSHVILGIKTLAKTPVITRYVFKNHSCNTESVTTLELICHRIDLQRIVVMGYTFSFLF